MNRVACGFILVLAVGCCAPAHASGAFTGRVGLTGGTYDFSGEVIDTGCCGSPGQVLATDESDDATFGLLAGTGIGVGRFFADFGLEYSQFGEEEDIDGDGVPETTAYRSDGLLTLGVFLGDRWTIFGGYRNATFGDGFFSDDGGNVERGPFLGGGVSFRLGQRFSLGTSLAFSSLTYKEQGTAIDDLTLTGLSAKLQLSLLETPHSVFLRFQRFSGDFEPSGFGFKLEYDENYINLGYQATFDFTTW